MTEEATSSTPAPQEGEVTTTETPVSEPKTFDAEYVRKLRAEAAAHRKDAQEAKSRVEEYENANRSELEKAQTKTAKAERERDEAKAALLRYEVAQEKEVPAKLVPLLTGKTREELEAQAALILENAKPAAPPNPEFDGGTRETAPAPTTPDQAHNDFLVGLFGAR